MQAAVHGKATMAGRPQNDKECDDTHFTGTNPVKYNFLNGANLPSGSRRESMQGPPHHIFDLFTCPRLPNFQKRQMRAAAAVVAAPPP